MLERFMSQKKKSYQGRSVAEIGLERPESRLKLWQLETRSMAAWAASEKIEFVLPPSQAFDADGFLDRRFYSDDATHANAQYGALVIDQVSAILKESTKVSADG
jgi:hypothetical protein